MSCLELQEKGWIGGVEENEKKEKRKEKKKRKGIEREGRKKGRKAAKTEKVEEKGSECESVLWWIERRTQKGHLA